MATYVPLPDSRRTLLPNSRPAGPIDKSEMASLTVRVRSTGDLAVLWYLPEYKIFIISTTYTSNSRRAIKPSHYLVIWIACL